MKSTSRRPRLRRGVFAIFLSLILLPTSHFLWSAERFAQIPAVTHDADMSLGGKDFGPNGKRAAIQSASSLSLTAFLTNMPLDLQAGMRANPKLTLGEKITTKFQNSEGGILSEPTHTSDLGPQPNPAKGRKDRFDLRANKATRPRLQQDDIFRQAGKMLDTVEPNDSSGRQAHDTLFRIFDRGNEQTAPAGAPVQADSTHQRICDLLNQELEGDIGKAWRSHLHRGYFNHDLSGGYSVILAKHLGLPANAYTVQFFDSHMPLYWEEVVSGAARSLRIWLGLRAQKSESSPEDYVEQMARSKTSFFKEERAVLRKTLLRMAERASATDTAFFRAPDEWYGTTEEYLNDLIRRKIENGDKFIGAKSGGSSIGLEAYSLAVLIDRVLRAQGQNPRDWRVVIEAFDRNISCLLAAQRGIYSDSVFDRDREPMPKGRHPGRNKQYLKRYGLKRDGLARFISMFCGWIQPIYMDLNDMNPASLVLNKANILFANNVFGYLNEGAQQYWRDLFGRERALATENVTPRPTWFEPAYPALLKQDGYPTIINRPIDDEPGYEAYFRLGPKS